jgi:hypothetical protein
VEKLRRQRVDEQLRRGRDCDRQTFKDVLDGGT